MNSYTGHCRCAMSPDERRNHEKERCAGQEELQKLAGTLARAPIYVYPPGSYIVNTGEIITAETVEKLCAYQAAGLHIRGI